MAKEIKLTEAEREGLKLRITQNANKNPEYFDHVQTKLNQKAQDILEKENSQQEPTKEQKKIVLKKILLDQRKQNQENYEKTNNTNRSAENGNENANSAKSEERSGVQKGVRPENT